MAAPADASPSVPSEPRPAFQCGPRVFSIDEILVAAECLGELAPFRTAWWERLAAARAAEAAGLAPADAAVEDATNTFRYARDLVTADECERWLAARGLDFADLTACMVRRLQAGLSEIGDVANADGAVAPAPDDERLLRKDALLADEFSGWARQLARRIAVATEAGHPPGVDFSLAASWVELDRALGAVAAAVLTPERRQRALVGHRLELTRVTFEVAEFDSRDAAREAILCAREDRAALHEIAAANALPWRREDCLLGDVPTAWTDVLISARPGEVMVPGVDNGGIVALAVLARREPTLDDAAIRGRVDAWLIEQHLCELESRHIRWLINVEIAS